VRPALEDLGAWGLWKTLDPASRAYLCAYRKRWRIKAGKWDLYEKLLSLATEESEAYCLDRDETLKINDLLGK